MPSEAHTHTVCPPGLVALFEDLLVDKNENSAVKMILASVIDLVTQDIIVLELESKKRRLGLGSAKKLYVFKKTELPSDPICDRMSEAISGENQSITKVVHNFWGQISWSEHRRVVDPFEDVEKWVKEEMVKQGFMKTVSTKTRLGLEKKSYEPIIEKLNPLESDARRLKEQIQQFQAQNPDLYMELVKGIKQGVSSREPIDTGVAE